MSCSCVLVTHTHIYIYICIYIFRERERGVDRPIDGQIYVARNSKRFKREVNSKHSWIRRSNLVTFDYGKLSFASYLASLTWPEALNWLSDPFGLHYYSFWTCATDEPMFLFSVGNGKFLHITKASLIRLLSFLLLSYTSTNSPYYDDEIDWRIHVLRVFSNMWMA